MNNFDKEERTKREEALKKEHRMRKFIHENPSIHPEASSAFSCWLKFGQPDYLDLVILYCHGDNYPVKGVLLHELAICSQKRLLREFNYETKSKLMRNLIKEWTYQSMFKLIEFCDFDPAKAAEKTAHLRSIYFPNYTMKRSSILKGYPDWLKSNSDYTDLIKKDHVINSKHGELKFPSEWTEEEQNNFISGFPDKKIPTFLIGKRQ